MSCVRICALLYTVWGMTGCTHLRITEMKDAGVGEDWLMYGGSVQRSNVTHSRVVPPLTAIWEYDASAGFSSSSAAIADGIVFVANLQGEVHAINLATGEGMGTYDFGEAVVGTPIIDGHLMYLPLSNTEEGLVAYDLRAGRVRWRLKIGEVETSPLLVGDRVYVATIRGTLVCIEKNSGAVVWTYTIPGRSRMRSVRSSPASDGSLIVFGCDDGSVYAVRIDNGALRWVARSGGAVAASPSISRNRVFIGSLDGTFYAFSLDSGTAVWTRRLGARIAAAQAVDSARIYVGTADRVVCCLNINSGDVLWRTPTDGIVDSAPLLAGDILYVGSLGGTIYALSASDGAVLWKRRNAGRLKTMPVASKNMLVVLSEDRTVTAFGSTPR